MPSKLSRGNREPAVSFPGNRNHPRLDRRLTERRELFAHPLKLRRPTNAVRKGRMIVRARDQGRAAAPVVKDDRAAVKPGEEDSRNETSVPPPMMQQSQPVLGASANDTTFSKFAVHQTAVSPIPDRLGRGLSMPSGAHQAEFAFSPR